MSSLKVLGIKLNLQLPEFQLSSSLPQKKKKKKYVKRPNPASIEIDVTLSLFSIFLGRLLFWAPGIMFYAFRLKPGFIFYSTI